MKKYLKLLICFAVMIFAVTMMAACSDGGPESIFIDTKDMPQLTFVQKENLDLSRGTLTVKYKNKTERIPLDSEDIKVSGYDANKLDEQKLIIEYKGLTTELKVKTVPRFDIIQSNIYFEGESINLATEELMLYNNNGTFSIIRLNDANLTIGDYDFSKAGANAVSVSYKDPVTKTEYSGSISINVIKIKEIVLGTLPKTEYGSHEKEPDLNGFITVKGENGESKNVRLADATLVSGFDFDKATPANRVTPLQQEVVFNYKGHPVKYNIRITYSDISVILDSYNAIVGANIDWSGDGSNAKFSKKIGTDAIYAATLYNKIISNTGNKLYKELPEYVTDEQRDLVIRVAVMQAYSDWDNDLKSFKKAFELIGETIYFYFPDYATTKKAVDDMSDKDRPYFTSYSFLSSIIENKKLSGIEITNGDNVIDYAHGFVYHNEEAKTFTYANQLIDNIMPVVELIVRIYGSMEKVTIENASSNSDILDGVVSTLKNTYYKGDNYRAYYGMMASWENHVFETIYSYYYSLGDDSSLETLNSIANNIYIPYGLEDLYLYLMRAFSELQRVIDFQNIHYVNETDTTYALFAIKMAEEIIANIDESGMQRDLFKDLALEIKDGSGTAKTSFANFLSALKQSGNFGYYYYTMGFAKVEKVDNVMKEYIGIYRALSENADSYVSSELEAAVVKMFNDFVDLSPAEQYQFLSAISSLYYIQDQVLSSRFMLLDYMNYGVSNDFVALIATYFESKFEDNDWQLYAYRSLLKALETLANVNYTENVTNDDFIKEMNEFEGSYSFIETGKSEFDAQLGALKNKLELIKDFLVNGNDAITQESESLFEELAQSFNKLSVAASFINNGSAYYDIYCALFEQAEAIANQIKNGNDENAKMLYYYGKNVDFGKEKVNADCMLYSFRRSYINLLTLSTAAYRGEPIIILEYYNQDIMDFLSIAVDQYSALIDSIASPGSKDKFFDKDQVMNMIEAFLALSDDNKSMYYQIGGIDQFGSVIIESFKEYLDDNESIKDYESFISELFKLENIYILSLISPEGNIVEEDNTITPISEYLSKTQEKVKEKYQAIVDNNTDVTKLNEYFGDMYEFFTKESE